MTNSTINPSKQSSGGISRRRLLAGSAGLALALAAGGRQLAYGQEAAPAEAPAAAGNQTHEVRMLNKGPEGRPMQFDPAFLKIAPGDSVKFVPTDKGHNSESILEMIPEGAETWKGKINEEITVTFDVEGIFGYKCQPHFGLGMVGLIQVGESTDNLGSADAAKLPGRAKERMSELVAQVGTSEATGASSTN